MTTSAAHEPAPAGGLSRRLLLTTAAATGLAVATGCSTLPFRRDPPPADPSIAAPSGQLTLIQGRVTTFTGPGGASRRVGYRNRSGDRRDLVIVGEDDPAGFESSVDVHDADVLPIAGAWWRFDDAGDQGGRAALTATPIAAPARPPSTEVNLLFVDGAGRLGSLSRMEITTLTSSGATIKRWTGTDLGDDSEQTELIALSVGQRIEVGEVAITAERFQPTSDVQRGYVAFSSSAG